MSGSYSQQTYSVNLFSDCIENEELKQKEKPKFKYHKSQTIKTYRKTTKPLFEFDESPTSNGKPSSTTPKAYRENTKTSSITPPRAEKKQKGLITSTSVKKERKFKDILDLEMETTEKKKVSRNIINSYEDLQVYHSSNSSSPQQEKFVQPSRLHTDFNIQETLGNGSFGKVYKCTKKIDHKEYAIKETFRKFIGKNKSHALNEAQALASLTAINENSNIVRYYSSWVEDQKLYLVMEYCPSSLKAKMNGEGPLKENEIKKVLRDMCVSLKYIHSQDVVHLDIKPENILISKHNTYKLGDLGQSALAIKTHEDIEEGDSRYLARELLNYDPDTDDQEDLKKADIFSLGVTLYELCINESMPANGNEWHSMRDGILPKLEAVHSIPSSLKQLIIKMMSPNPKERPTASDILHQYVRSKQELELRWQKVLINNLEARKNDLEALVFEKRSRRNSC